MGKNATDLLPFLAPFPDDIKETALWLREFVWDLYPESNELIYDNYNALAFGFSLSDTAGDAFCSIAVFGKHINFGFNRGSELPDEKGVLIGNGSLYRYIKVTDKVELLVMPIKKLLQLSYVNALARLKERKKPMAGQTIVKMALAKTRRPGSVPKTGKTLKRK